MDPAESVKQAENAYNEQNIEKIMQLFHPDVVVFWNGKKIVEGIEECRALHEKWGIRKDFSLKKTLRAASGDTITVEWKSTWVDDNGDRNHGFGGEFWTMADEKLKEWHAYYTKYVEGMESGDPV